MQKDGMTVREIIAELELVAEDLKDKELVVRAENTGFRTVFPKGDARLTYTCIAGVFLMEYCGTQDRNQLLR